MSQASPRTCAVVGSPVDRSLSPVLHSAAYADLGLESWRYTRREVPAGTLAHHLRRFARYGIDDQPCGGLSVTMPLKTEALKAGVTGEHSASTQGLAQWAQSANTLIPGSQAGTWEAHNTDVVGIRRAFGECGVIDARGSICVIGSGDTASSAIVALALMGADAITLLARDRSRADRAFAVAERSNVELRFQHFGELSRALLAADITVSTVPPGVIDDLEDIRFGAGQAVLDAAYTQGATPLLQAVRRDGASAVDGTLMLLHQAVVQVELMTGCSPDVEVMRRALEAHARS